MIRFFMEVEMLISCYILIKLYMTLPTQYSSFIQIFSPQILQFSRDQFLFIPTFKELKGSLEEKEDKQSHII